MFDLKTLYGGAPLLPMLLQTQGKRALGGSRAVLGSWGHEPHLQTEVPPRSLPSPFLWRKRPAGLGAVFLGPDCWILTPGTASHSPRASSPLPGHS